MGWLSQQTGQQKERQAALWLQQQHVQLVAQNFRCRGGEIDLIGLDPQHTLIFVEVKARKNTEYGHPSEFITAQKQRRLQQCAQYFLLTHPQYQNHSCRFDSIIFIGQNPPEWQQNIIGY